MDGSNKGVVLDDVNADDVENNVDLGDVYSVGGDSIDGGGVDDVMVLILIVVMMLTIVMVIAKLMVLMI